MDENFTQSAACSGECSTCGSDCGIDVSQPTVTLTLDDDTEVRRIQVGGKLVGKTIQEIDVRRAYGINIIAIVRNHQTNVDFSAQYCFQEGDNVAVVGKIDKIDRFEADIQQ